MQPKLLLPTLLMFGAISAQAQNGTPFWSLAGNNNASSSAKLGTLNSDPLNLTTNNATRIYIAPGGFVGIGTTTPTSLLNVRGKTLLSTFTSTDALSPQSGAGVIGYTSFTPTARGQRLGYFLTGSQNGGSDAGNSTGLVGYADGAWTTTSRPAYMTFETTNSGSRLRTEAMRIASDGYVGIGTTTPFYRLHVQDSSIAILAQGLGTTSSYGIYGTSAIYGVYGAGKYGVVGSGSNYGTYGAGTDRGAYGTGKVGVYGTSSADYGDGVHGTATGTGAYGGYFESTSSIGVYAYTASTSSYAGYFSGNVYTSGSYNTSDKKLKKNIAEFTDAMSIIKKLKPKTYEFLTDGKLAAMNLPKGKHFGLIAQELETVLPELVKETPQILPRNNDTTRDGKFVVSTAKEETFKAVNYSELIPIVIKGMQEQDQKLQAMDSLRTEVQSLKATVEELKSLLNKNVNAYVSGASLDVPVPNPSKGSATVRYNVPAGAISAKLILVNMSGQVMKEVSLAGGAGQVNLSVSNLATGIYPCSLWVNGQQVATKQMVVSH